MRITTHHLRRLQRRAFFTADILLSLSIVSVLSVALATAVGRTRLAESRLADSRAATRFAERGLLNLQQHQPLPSLVDASIEAHFIPDTEAPAGYRWVSLEAKVHGRSVNLLGVVPADVQPEAGSK